MGEVVLKRTRQLLISEIAGVRLLLVHAIDELAASFYQRNGFTALPNEQKTLALDLVQLRNGIGS